MIDPTKLRKGDYMTTLISKPNLPKGSTIEFIGFHNGKVLYDEIVPEGSKIKYAGALLPCELDYDSHFPPCADDYQPAVPGLSRRYASEPVGDEILIVINKK